MTGKWCQPGVPHKGWICEEVIDLENDRAICEMCEVQEIRYQHVMNHPDYLGKLLVGCNCAGHMEENTHAAKQRETVAKSKSAFFKRNWRMSRRGNPFLNWKGHHASIWPANIRGAYHMNVDGQKLGLYFSERAAKEAIYEVTQ